MNFFAFGTAFLCSFLMVSDPAKAGLRHKKRKKLEGTYVIRIDFAKEDLSQNKIPSVFETINVKEDSADSSSSSPPSESTPCLPAHHDPRGSLDSFGSLGGVTGCSPLKDDEGTPVSEAKCRVIHVEPATNSSADSITHLCVEGLVNPDPFFTPAPDTVQEVKSTGLSRKPLYRYLTKENILCGCFLVTCWGALIPLFLVLLDLDI